MLHYLFFFLLLLFLPTFPLFPYTTLFRSICTRRLCALSNPAPSIQTGSSFGDRKSTRLNSSHVSISYAVFCLKKKKTTFSLFRTFCIFFQTILTSEIFFCTSF